MTQFSRTEIWRAKDGSGSSFFRWVWNKLLAWINSADDRLVVLETGGVMPVVPITVADKTALAAIETPSDEALYSVEDWDGSGNSKMFVYDAESTATADGSYIIEPTASGVTGFYIAVGLAKHVHVTADITDISAAGVPYTNTTSGLTATEVQSAIDEIDGVVDGLATTKMALVASPVADNLVKQDVAGQAVDTGLAVTTLAPLGVKTANSTDTAQECATATPTTLALEDSVLAGSVVVAETFDTFTVPHAGLYAILAKVTFAGASAGTYRQLDVLVNDSASNINDDQGAAGISPVALSDSGFLGLAAGDVLKLSATQDSGSALNVTAAELWIQQIS